MITLLEVATTLEKFVEKASRPGVLGLPGRKIEKRTAVELKQYFERVGAEIVGMNLQDRIMHNAEAAKHVVDMALHNVLRKNRQLLLDTLQSNMEKAYLTALKLDYVKEADDFQLTPDDPGITDAIGDSAKKAAEWASQNAGELVTGIDQTTSDLISDAVANGIENQLGVGGIARAIKDIVDSMTTNRAEMIAATEINRAMSAAAFDKMDDLNIEYKQVILSDDACPICEDNAAADPLPIDEDYPSGDSGPPFHPNCRCAITGARAPEIEESVDDEPRDDHGRWTSEAGAEKEFRRQIKKNTVFAHETSTANIGAIKNFGIKGGHSAESTVFATVGEKSNFYTGKNKATIHFRVPPDQHHLITHDMRYTGYADLLNQHGGSIKGADVAINRNVPKTWIHKIVDSRTSK